MGKCIIFCAAGFRELIEPIEKTDYVIAADGGLRHTNALHLTPDAVLGDFDSLEYVPEGANVFPVEKDDTDCMLAVRHGLSKGYRSFLIYGGMDGERLDHTVANYQTLQFLADHGARGILVGNDFLATVIREDTIVFPSGVEGGASLFCMGRSARGVTLRGLYYPLENGSLTPGFPLGVSNHFTGETASVTVEQGSLLMLWERRAGLPVRWLEETGEGHAHL